MRTVICKCLLFTRLNKKKYLIADFRFERCCRFLFTVMNNSTLLIDLYVVDHLALLLHKTILKNKCSSYEQVSRILKVVESVQPKVINCIRSSASTDVMLNTELLEDEGRREQNTVFAECVYMSYWYFMPCHCHYLNFCMLNQFLKLPIQNLDCYELLIIKTTL